MTLELTSEYTFRMKGLGIESSCDETSIAIVENGKNILFHTIASQAELHEQYGGVFPEIASRQHIDRLLPLIEEGIKRVGKIDFIAVANGPGLVGSLLMGTVAAKTLAYSWNLPLVGVNHVEAHLYAPMMGDGVPSLFPSLGVVLSGGHTFLAKMTSIETYTIIGTTVDDAVGEAFDKVAKLLELPYPGGPPIETLAEKGDPFRYPFKAGQVKGRALDFSFSGLKTSVLYTLKGKNGLKTSPDSLDEREKKHIAASFQRAAFSDILSKILRASKTFPCRAIYLGGGVTSSNTLKTLLKEEIREFPLYFPPKNLSLDNGAMIAGLGYHLLKTRHFSHPFQLKVFPKMSLLT